MKEKEAFSSKTQILSSRKRYTNKGVPANMQNGELGFSIATNVYYIEPVGSFKLRLIV